MGSSMCGHLMAERLLPSPSHTRTRQKAQPLLDRGATWADTPRAVAERSDVVFSIVGFPAGRARSDAGLRRDALPAASQETSWWT